MPGQITNDSCTREFILEQVDYGEFILGQVDKGEFILGQVD